MNIDGSEAIYKKDGQWHVVEITDNSGEAFHKKDKANIDIKSLEKR